MTSYNMSSGSRKQEKSEKALRWIGCLDHPFYNDERHRYVWYEASSIAFQMLLIGSTLTTGLVLWIAGSKALPYALVFFLPTVVTALVFNTYIKRRNAEYAPEKKDLTRRRSQFGILTSVFMVSGFARAAIDLTTRSGEGFPGSFTRGFGQGMIVGLVAIVPITAGIFMYERSKQNKDEERAEL